MSKRLRKIAILFLVIFSIVLGILSEVRGEVEGSTNCREQGCSTGFYPCAVIEYPDGTKVRCLGPAP
jgi:hypothetical protein